MADIIINVSTQDNDTTDLKLKLEGTTLKGTLGKNTTSVDLSGLIPRTFADRFVNNGHYDLETKSLVLTAAKEGEEDIQINIPMTDLFNLISTLKGEKGDKGDKGDKGEIGATGSAGKDGKSITITHNEQVAEGTRITFSDSTVITIPSGNQNTGSVFIEYPFDIPSNAMKHVVVYNEENQILTGVSKLVKKVPIPLESSIKLTRLSEREIVENDYNNTLSSSRISNGIVNEIFLEYTGVYTRKSLKGFINANIRSVAPYIPDILPINSEDYEQMIGFNNPTIEFVNDDGVSENVTIKIKFNGISYLLKKTETGHSRYYDRFITQGDKAINYPELELRETTYIRNHLFNVQSGEGENNFLFIISVLRNENIVVELA